MQLMVGTAKVQIQVRVVPEFLALCIHETITLMKKKRSKIPL